LFAIQASPGPRRNPKHRNPDPKRRPLDKHDGTTEIKTMEANPKSAKNSP